MDIPKTHAEFQEMWTAHQQEYLTAYQTQEISFIPNLLPEQALRISARETLAILQARLGITLAYALAAENTNPQRPPAELPMAIRTPVAAQPDGQWLKQTNMVGINVRTIGSFWKVINYSLTLPAAQNSIHLLPIFEPGVVGSLYGMSSWLLNPEFFSPELAAIVPHLDTVDKQLRAVINLLHALGRTVGMDVIPHTDRFSEITLMYPEYFEWLRREDVTIVDHTANLHEAVQARLNQFLALYGSAIPTMPLPPNLFAPTVDEITRQQALFGLPNDYDGRQQRRVAVVKYLVRYGYEPVPATMGPPYRGLKVVADERAVIVDGNELVWRDFAIADPQPMSRVFGPLGRYKLYERLDDNRTWQIDFTKPRPAVWDYICRHYSEVQQRYGFDFMRGDMSHVQMRPDGVPAKPDATYDPLRAVKRYIQARVPSFGYFAETFLAPRDTIAYGDEVDHLEASEADTTLGDLQSTVVGSAEFLHKFRHYYDLLETRLVTPNFTLMTADKDDPRFDKFYLKGNELRLFMALGLADMPSYMGLGFETRDVHYYPAPNEHYTKLYVFQESDGPKATHGPYQWGKNGYLFHHITRLKHYWETIGATIQGQKTRWLVPPHFALEVPLIVWTQAEMPTYLFMANTDLEQPWVDFTLPLIPNAPPTIPLTAEFSTVDTIPPADVNLTSYGTSYKVQRLAPGEGRIYRLEYEFW